ncbi:MerR family transcriptional regulator [Anaeromicropila herbilytica]|uniref:MerR family transcriptional regulator n=1 Tax=Anaeromicropila herbilytica TaxID=2785025 RepID=A0A7R7IG41_9FIRM|nr:MerR family transcriptional regulator [Anaeromicropila herbilytica]BCN32693.1 MerR family transcriptional regulator [Anaeromicropila herbilytica]
MFKIGEFSRITQVSIRMLRYYDEQGLLNPSLVDKSNGYRLYTADQIEMLNRIVLLRNLGFGVKEMKNMLASWNSEMMLTNLLKQIEKTQENIKIEQNRLMQMQGYLIDLHNQDKKLNIEIIMKQIPMQHVISLRRIMPSYYQEGMLWKELTESVEDIESIASNSSFSIYHDLDYREQDVDIEVCVVTEKELKYIGSDLIYRQVDAVPMAACFMIYGPYSNISIAYKEFAFWLEKHPEYRMAGENRQICHVSMCHTTNSEEYITELQIPLKYNEK